MNLTTLIKIGEELGENPSFGERAVVGLQVVAIGMGVIFAVLILLIGILQLFKLFSGEKKKASVEVKETVNTAAPVSTAASSQVPVNASEEAKIVAIATAAIAASRGQSEVNFNVISIAPIGGATVKAEAAPSVKEAPAAPVDPAPVSAPAPAPAPASAPVATGDGEKISAPLPGNILDVKVSNGSAVKKGDILCILEAMKMENEIVAPVDGTIVNTVATKGSSVNTGDLLFVIG